MDVDQEEEIGSGAIQNFEDYMLRYVIFTSAIAQKKLQDELVSWLWEKRGKKVQKVFEET